MTEERPIEILLIEDNPGDVRLLSDGFKAARVKNILRVVGDGVEALNYLRHLESYRQALPPDLILLDLNLPKLDGREVLAQVKKDPDLRHIPVIVLTGSQSDLDVLNSYYLQANCFITKPFGFDNFQKVIKAIEEFWLMTARLPRKELDG